MIDFLPPGMNLQAPPNHPDPIYAGFRSRPQDRGPPRGQHHRGGRLKPPPTPCVTRLCRRHLCVYAPWHAHGVRQWSSHHRMGGLLGAGTALVTSSSCNNPVSLSLKPGKVLPTSPLHNSRKSSAFVQPLKNLPPKYLI